MKRIHYADEYLVTGDRIAGALVDYARALAMKGRSDTVDLPGMDRDGVRQRFQILLGPASQMLVSEQQTREDDIEDDLLVRDIEQRVEHLQSAQPQVEQNHVSIPLDSDEF